MTAKAHTAVIVVHGVGDPKPGDALDELVQGLVGSTDWVESEARRLHHRAEPLAHGTETAKPPLVPTYPEHAATLSADPARPEEPARRLALREVYWGDLSRVKGSAVALLYALFDLLFGMRHLVRVARDEADAAARAGNGWLRFCIGWGGRCARTSLRLVRGPLFALNILAAAVAVVYVALERAFLSTGPLPLGEPVVPAWIPALAAFVAALGVTAAGWGMHAALQRRGWSPLTVQWMKWLGLAALAMLVLVGRPASIDTAVAWVTTSLTLFALWLAIAGIGMVALHLLGILAAGQLEVAQRLRLRRAVTVTTFCTALAVGLFTFSMMVAWTVLRGGAAPRLQARIDEGLHLFVLVWFAFALVAALYLGIVAVNAERNRRKDPGPRLRYIVNRAVVVAFVGFSLVNAVLFLPLGVMVEHDQLCGDWRLGGLCTNERLWGWIGAFREGIEPVERMVGVGVAASGLLVALLIASRTHLLTALDLVLDVIAHFRTDEPGDPRQRETRLWNAMVARFRDVVGRAAEVTQADRLIVIAHSQGTMIALQGLGLLRAHGRQHSRIAPERCSVTLVTMGCPLEHVYRHYLPERYPLASRAQAGVAEWINIYRIDDFIGTRIDVPKDAGPTTQVPIDPRGHTDYWRDRDVLDVLRPLLAPPAPSGPVATIAACSASPSSPPTASPAADASS